MPFGTSNLFSSSSRRRTTTTTNAATGQSYSDRGSQSISGLQLQSGASVSFNDLGAVGRAFDFAEANVRESMKQTSAATAAAVGAFQSAQQQAGAVNADQLLKLGVGAVVAVAVVLAWAASRKGKA